MAFIQSRVFLSAAKKRLTEPPFLSWGVRDQGCEFYLSEFTTDEWNEKNPKASADAWSELCLRCLKKGPDMSKWNEIDELREDQLYAAVEKKQKATKVDKSRKVAGYRLDPKVDPSIEGT
jgi:hypothetical protein